MKIIACLACVLSLGIHDAVAQQQAPQPPAPPAPQQQPRPAPPAPDPAAQPDVEITATVTAKSLRFEKVGQGTVTFNPEAPTSVFIVEHNLPTPIEPNRTYTDVVLKLLITTSLVNLLETQQPPAQPQPR